MLVEYTNSSNSQKPFLDLFMVSSQVCIKCFRGACPQHYINHMEGIRIRMNDGENIDRYIFYFHRIKHENRK